MGAAETTALPRRSLRANAAWNLAAQLLYAATQWGILVVLTKRTSPEVLGVFALATATTAPIYALLNLNLRGVQATDAEERFPFGTYLSHRLGSSLLAQLVVQAVVMLAGFDAFTRQVVMLVGLSKGVEAVSDVCYGLYQHRERMDGIGRSMIARGTGALLIFTALLWTTGDLRVALLGQLVSWTAVLLLHDLPVARRLVGGPLALTAARAPLIALTRLAWPLGIVVLLSSSTHSIPRWYLEGSVGTRELGIFAALAYLAHIGQTVVVAVTQAAIPRLARAFAAGQLRRFVGLAAGMLGVGALVGLLSVAVAAFAGEPILALLYTAEYAGEGSLFALVMLAGGVTYVARIALHVLTAARRFTVQLPIAAVGLATMVTGCALLVPTLGAAGAAWAWAGSQAVVAVVALGATGRALAQRRAAA